MLQRGQAGKPDLREVADRSINVRVANASHAQRHGHNARLHVPNIAGQRSGRHDILAAGRTEGGTGRAEPDPQEIVMARRPANEWAEAATTSSSSMLNRVGWWGAPLRE